MIQRIQTLYLIIAIGLTIAFLFIPFGYAPTVDTVTGFGVLQPLKATEFTGLIVPVAVAVVCMIAAIFTYKKYPLQKLLCVLAALSLLTTAGVVIYAVVSPFIDNDPNVTIATTWGGGGLFVVAALIAVCAAHHYISKDQALIRSYDRIR